MDITIFGHTFSLGQLALGSAALILPVPAAYLVYSGLFRKTPKIVCRRPPYGKMRVAYKFKVGPYGKQVGNQFCEVHQLDPERTCVGVYYDDPDKAPRGKCRYLVGAILAEGDETPDPSLVRKYEENGYSLITLPEVAAAVQTRVAVSTPMSYLLLIPRAYVDIDKYIRDHKLKWNPALEIYDGDSIQFMVPQSDGDKFCIPEVPYDALNLE